MVANDEQCPLHAVDQRLDDLHRQWHEAVNSYFDPEGFRVAIQTAIQTSRTVTFILQGSKRFFPNFDAWYSPWQEKFKIDPLMRWMVEARNRIEKQGDLEANSLVRAEILASYLNEGPKLDVKAALFDSVSTIFKTVPQSVLKDHIMKQGFLRIERRWVENSLPDYELLDAVAIAFGRLTELVHDAHLALGLPEPAFADPHDEARFDRVSMGWRMPCMVGHADRRTIDIWLATGKPVEFEAVAKTIDASSGKCLAIRYGVEPEDVFGRCRDLEDITRNLFRTARAMFERDGYHVMIIFLMRNSTPVDIIEWRPAEHGHKYVLARRLADEVKKTGADAIIEIGEIWRAKADPNNPYQRAQDAKDRTEALCATLVRKHGEPLMLIAEIARNWRRARLAETIELRGGAQFSFAPVYAAWEKEIPKDWTVQGGEADCLGD